MDKIFQDIGVKSRSPDPWRQLEQHVQCRAGQLELEQRPVELEHEHRLFPRSHPTSDIIRSRPGGQNLDKRGLHSFSKGKT